MSLLRQGYRKGRYGMTVNRKTRTYGQTHTENFAENYIGSALRRKLCRQLYRSAQSFRDNLSSLPAFLPL